MLQQPAVTLTEEERRTLETFVHRGKANARTLTRARILLKSADGWSTAALAAAFDVCEATVTNVRGRFAQGGLEAVLHDKVQQHRRLALSGLQTAHLIAITCSPTPDGHDRLLGAVTRQQSGGTGLCLTHFPQHHPPTAQKNELKPWQHGAPLRRQLRSAPNGAGTDGRFHAYPAYPNLRKERATRACGEGPRRRKSLIFRVVHARRVWRKLYCLNPSVIIPMVLQIGETMVLQRVELEGKASSSHFWVFG
jgi:Winged helix-turn helix